MLQNRQSRQGFLKFGNQPRGRTQIQNIVIGKLLPVQLLEGFQESPVESCFLMWILSISQRLGPAPDDTRRLLQNRLLFFRMPRQIRTDQMIVMGRVPKDFRGQFSSCSQSRIPRHFHFLLHQPVVGRIGHHRYRLMILRRAPQHTRSTDIDIFDRLLRGAVGPRHRLLKRIKIHHHQIDRRNLVLCRLFTMCRQIPSLQKSSMHLGM